MAKKESPVCEPGLLGRCIADHGDIWQMRLLNPSRLSSFVRDRGVGFWESHIKQLWQLKLLRADLVISRRKLRKAGLIEVGVKGEYRYYADERQPRRRTNGWLDATESLSSFPDNVELYFHPFRYYVLYLLERSVRLSIHPYQMIITKQYPKMLEFEITRFQKWSSTPEFTQLVSRWNDIVALCVLTEPCFYENIFHSLKYSPLVGFEEQRKRIEKHWGDIVHCYQALDVDELEKIRGELCLDAEMLDENKDVHTLLRLSHGGFRQKVKGRLGGALVVKTMAEMLRRATERTYNVKLREEDELGFGVTPLGMKKNLYGAERILDNESAARQYLRSFNLDYGVRIRWYVEGDTEYGALDYVLGRSRSIELLNLKGNVVQGGRRGAAFVDNLKNDLRAQVFSVVLIDGDNDDYVRVVRKAAEDDLICGMFYISDPDFEFENFSLNELENILWEIASENGAVTNERYKLHNAIRNATSGKELIKSAKRALPELNQISKGISWGQRLIRYALKNPEMQDADGAKVGTRLIIEAINASIQGLNADYHMTRKKYKIDPSSGRLVMRDDAT